MISLRSGYPIRIKYYGFWMHNNKTIKNVRWYLRTSISLTYQISSQNQQILHKKDLSTTIKKLFSIVNGIHQINPWGREIVCWLFCFLSLGFCMNEFEYSGKKLNHLRFFVLLTSNGMKELHLKCKVQ